MDRRAHDITKHIERKERVFIYFKKAVCLSNDIYLPLFWLSLYLHAFTHESMCKGICSVVFVHLVVCDIQHKEIFLAEPLKMADIFLPDNMSFLEGPSLKLSRTYLCYVMGKDSADGFGNSQFFCSGVMILLR